jgi:hypothetical protein
MYACEPSTDIAQAWLNALDHLIENGGHETNLIVTIGPSPTEEVAVRKQVDLLLKTDSGPTLESVRKVANTIFPIDFYRPQLGKNAEAHLYCMARRARIVHIRSNRVGTYFDRLIDYRSEDETINQLEHAIKNIRTLFNSIANRKRPSANYLEIAVDDPIIDKMCDCSLRVQIPGVNTNIMGFPCLSHISLTLFRGCLNMTATYRNQDFIRKAYGNYVGLSDLLRFICETSGAEVGELVCVATHGYTRIGKLKARELLGACRKVMIA